MRIVAIMWDSLCPLLISAAERQNADMSVFANRRVDGSDEIFDEAVSAMKDADLIILYRTTHGFWERMEAEVKKIRSGKRIVCVGQDPTYWSLSTAEPKVCSDIYSYLLNGSPENFDRLIDYIDMVFGGREILALPPVVVPWQGIVHPRFGDRVFESTDEYLAEYGGSGDIVALIISRSAWITGQKRIEEEMISDLEDEGLRVIPVMTNSLHNEEYGSLNIAECMDRYLISDGKPIASAVIKMVTFMIGKKPSMTQEEAAGSSADILKGLNIPIFQPIISYDMTIDDWRDSDTLSADIAWSIAMPEFEGAIEPLMLGTTRMNDGDCYNRAAIPGRGEKIARRVKKWIGLKKKERSECRTVLILNNNPCASVEANIGSAAGLDAIRSTVGILRELHASGYDVSVPKDAEDLIDAFNSRKATSEFRWTSVADIVSSGGAVYRMSTDEYRRYFDTLPEKVRADVVRTWGEPPGQSMIVDGDIIITGLKCGNAVVAVQPKRGCYGSKCDGSVCKILHDPDCPPTHQYLATYHFFRDVFKADFMIHVGTHGSLEFLPGKGTGLSEECYPDICIGDTPMVYVYNTDNPPEGSIAKRRCYATLIGHMQTPMAASGLYGDLITLDNLLAQYETASGDDARKHALHHMILDAVAKAGLNGIGISHETPMDETVRKCHEVLTGIRTSRIEVGMHTFGEMPEGRRLAELITSMIRYDIEGKASPRKTISSMYSVSYPDMLVHPEGFNKDLGISNGAVMEMIDKRIEMMVRMALNGSDADDVAEAIGRPAVEGLQDCIDRVRSIRKGVEDSDEMGSLLNSAHGGFTPPGPSGYMTRGREDILPTGRNFYSLDPKRVPTTSSWRVGTRLADALLDKYLNDEGKYPESVAFQWMTSDIMAADGEMMAEIFSLIGAEPVWENSGHVTSFKIVPYESMSHPRIDVTIRISGILRDNFPNCVDLVDSAIVAVSELDEPYDVNLLRKHTDLDVRSGASREEATARIFSSKPGTYASGVNLAVLSGAWKDEKDLAEIYIATNGYAYGNSRKGRASHEQFASGLENVSLTFNKVMTDEHDLLGCCCYYSNQGGMTAAARHLSGKDVKAYYGDTRETEAVSVRTLSDEINRVARSKLLNPAWMDGMKEHGYKGAADMMKKITRVYGWEASTQEVDDRIFDDIASKYINDDDMRKFFRDNNPYAAEEISRRLLEAETRGLWKADPKVLDDLRGNYAEIESWMEDLAGSGDIQGGEVSIMSPSEIEGLGSDISKIMDKVHGRRR